ncbi:MAG: SBBP repeat-containing protein, partial [Planctomycetes bacterium]|nr:SBBP repeat-containing protein [Planctomycetota bacterium]
RGASSVTTSETGALRVATPAGSFEDAPPEAWQDQGGKRVPVEMAYRLDPTANGEGAAFGFELGDYDHTQPLVLDPSVFVYCGYIGGATVDYATAIAVDSAGNTYVAGYTDSSELTFPVSVGPDLTYNGFTYDAFVAKVDAQGTGLLYCGYIGGSTWDDAYGIAVDSTGCAYVAGSTYSSEQSFPVTVGPDLTFNGLVDAFVAKVNPQGTALLYCGYLGGNQRDVARAIAVDGAGQAYVTGWTRSSEQSFPVTVGPDLTFNGGGYDAFVAKVNAAGTGLLYCGYIGGTGSESGDGIAVDGAGNAYVTGDTISSEQSFPVVAGPDLTHNGNDDAFVAKVNPQGTALVYCGYIGGISADIAYGIAVDGAGSAYIAGSTYSDAQTFPVAVGPSLTFVGPSQSSDAFVAKIQPSGTGLVYCGYIGGIGQEEACAIAVDPSGNAYVTGYTLSDQRSFPVRIGPGLTYKGGSTVYGGDAFVAKVSATGGGLVYCGYINGVGDDGGSGIAVDAAGNVYVAGASQSNELSFPVAAGPDLTFNGGTDAFVAKLAFTLLQAGGDPRPGGTVNFLLTAVGSVGLLYQLGSSLGTGPILIDTRQIDLSPDALLAVSTADLWPAIFRSYRGIIDSQNQATAALCVPNVPALIGTRFHTAYVTLDPQAPSGVAWISNAETITIAK